MPLLLLSEIQSSRLQDIAAYLASKRHDSHKPLRAALDPLTEIPRLTSYLTLLEKLETGKYRVRLCGSVVADILGRDPTGEILDYAAEPDNEWGEHLAKVFASDALLSGTGAPTVKSRSHILFEWVAQSLTAEPGHLEIAIFGLDLHPGRSA